MDQASSRNNEAELEALEAKIRAYEPRDSNNRLLLGLKGRETDWSEAG